MPDSSDLPRRTDSGFRREQVVEYLQSPELIPVDLRHRYRLKLLEYFENLYGGNIVIGPAGHVLVEFKKGRQEGVDTGAASIEFFAIRDQFLGTLHYSFKSRKLRQGIHDALQAVGVTGSGIQKLKFTPGYYEFILIQRSKNSPLEPIFFDCRRESFYQPPWESWERNLLMARPAEFPAASHRRSPKDRPAAETDQSIRPPLPRFVTEPA